MSRPVVASLVFPGLLACVCLAGCGATPVTRYYTLQSVAGASAALVPESVAVNAAAVRVDPVIIPPELDRLEIVSRSGQYRVRISDSDRWAAPLDDQIRRVLSDDLAERLPPRSIADPTEPATEDARRLLSIAIVEFYMDDACATTLRVAWTLRGPGTHGQRGSERIQQPAVMPCHGDAAAGMSSALSALADRLAKMILAPPADTPAP